MHTGFKCKQFAAVCALQIDYSDVRSAVVEDNKYKK